jgi:hypothetical protein
MKASIDKPAVLHRRAEARAAERGQSLSELVVEALRDKLGVRGTIAAGAERPWMAGFGKLKRLRQKTARIQRRVDREFGKIQSDDRR